MKNWKDFVINENGTVRDALTIINGLGKTNSVLFLIDDNCKLTGTLTDGDIRRGLINQTKLDQPVKVIANTNYHKIVNGNLTTDYLKQCQSKGIFLLGNIDENGALLDIIDISDIKDLMPVDAVIMAGGRGQRLLPLTENLPKPLLKIGEKPIIEHNIDRLSKYGIKKFHISVNYLAQTIINYFGDGSQKSIEIEYIVEEKALGTFGSLSIVEKFVHADILVMNSDLLTNIDYSDFYNEYINEDADLAVATIPYHIDLPYAIMEIDGKKVTSLKEKPRYTYFANAGIYLLKRSLIDLLPKGEHFLATDFMDILVSKGYKVINYPILGYWLDIGKHDDFKKAQEDIIHLRF